MYDQMCSCICAIEFLRVEDGTIYYRISVKYQMWLIKALHFLAGCRKRQLNRGLVVSCLSFLTASFLCLFFLCPCVCVILFLFLVVSISAWKHLSPKWPIMCQIWDERLSSAVSKFNCSFVMPKQLFASWQVTSYEVEQAVYKLCQLKLKVKSLFQIHIGWYLIALSQTSAYRL